MPELRWILVFFGLVLLIGIYVWGRRSTKPAETHDDVMFRPDEDVSDREDIEPTLASTDEPVIEESFIPDPEPEPEPARVEDSPIAPPPRPFVAPRTTRADESREPRGARIEPSFGDEMQTAELPVSGRSSELDGVDPPPSPPATNAAPTIGMSNTPQPRRIERRKIVALRLAAGAQRFPGAQLQSAFESESLEHGKYDVFHRLDDQGVAMFSVASMVEPGTFDPSRMQGEQYTGITLFAQLPGPVAGMLAFNELVACSRRLHAALGGTLQDERGVPLTVHRIERIRQEIREFELRGASETQRPSPTYSS